MNNDDNDDNGDNDDDDDDDNDNNNKSQGAHVALLDGEIVELAEEHAVGPVLPRFIKLY